MKNTTKKAKLDFYEQMAKSADLLESTQKHLASTVLTSFAKPASKSALKEEFNPRMKGMLNAGLHEEDDEMEKEPMDDETPESPKIMNPAKSKMEAEEPSIEDMEDEEGEDEPEVKQEGEDSEDDIDFSAEDDEEDMEESFYDISEGDDEESEDDIDFSAEDDEDLEEGEGEYEDGETEDDDELEEAEKMNSLDDIFKEGSHEEPDGDEDEPETKKDAIAENRKLRAQNKKLFAENKKYKAALRKAHKTLKEQQSAITESTITNYKLSCITSLFNSRNLSESQKCNVIALFDKANTVREAKLVNESLKSKYSASNTNKKAVNETKLSSKLASVSGTMKSTKPSSKTINENTQANEVDKLVAEKLAIFDSGISSRYLGESKK